MPLMVRAQAWWQCFCILWFWGFLGSPPSPIRSLAPSSVAPPLGLVPEVDGVDRVLPELQIRICCSLGIDCTQILRIMYSNWNTLYSTLNTLYSN